MAKKPKGAKKKAGAAAFHEELLGSDNFKTVDVSKLPKGK